jgi:hypothetical protein
MLFIACTLRDRDDKGISFAFTPVGPEQDSRKGIRSFMPAAGPGPVTGDQSGRR